MILLEQLRILGERQPYILLFIPMILTETLAHWFTKPEVQPLTVTRTQPLQQNSSVTFCRDPLNIKSICLKFPSGKFFRKSQGLRACLKNGRRVTCFMRSGVGISK